jgi:hypothetical protein
MIITILAGAIFAILYGIAVRLYLFLRAQRDSTRWHPAAVLWSTLLGGAAFYVAQQIRMPHAPSLLDLAAFLIMCLGASAIPGLLELSVVLRSRLAASTTLSFNTTTERSDPREHSSLNGSESERSPSRKDA